jgi:hypothetical protein
MDIGTVSILIQPVELFRILPRKKTPDDDARKEFDEKLYE